MKNNELNKNKETLVNLKKEYYKLKMNGILNKPIQDKAFVTFNNHFYMIDSKYFSRFEKLANKYIQTEKGLNQSTFKYKVIGVLLGLGLLKLANGDFWEISNAQNVYSFEEYLYNSLFDLSFNIQSEGKDKEFVIDGENLNELKENQYIEKLALYDSYLTEYSDYFHFNSQTVIELARKTTKNYEDFSLIFPSSESDFTNPEAICMKFVYYLNRDKLALDLEEWGGGKKEEIFTNSKIETLSYDHTDDLIVNNGQKYSEYLGKICDLFQIDDKILALAVSFSEIGPEGSYSSRTRNNFGGMKYKSEHLIFPTPEAGIISFCANFKNNYNKYTLSSINELSYHYVTGKKTAPDPVEQSELCEETKVWAKNVKDFYFEIMENYDYYFSKQKYILKKTR